MSKTFLFQAIKSNSSNSNNSVKHKYAVSSIQLSQTVLIQTIQLSISMQLVLFTLSGATIPGQSGPGSNGNEGVLRIPQSNSNTGTSPSDCLESYQNTRWGGVLLPLQRSRWCILQQQPTGQFSFLTDSTRNINFWSKTFSFQRQIKIHLLWLLAALHLSK